MRMLGLSIFPLVQSTPWKAFTPQRAGLLVSILGALMPLALMASVQQCCGSYHTHVLSASAEHHQS